ncbi:MAG TPA: Gmad2 immunoglobulin-like domain-containing protein [Acidimicrobiia bacterium]|nr:Gmad2 immunoglobulin-like domain-containing protein [Acidimicrobiia bacterium]
MRRQGTHSIFVAAVAIAILTACGSSSKPTTAPTTPSFSPPTTAQAPVPVIVYLVQDDKLVAAGRTVTPPATPEAAVRALMNGPQGALERDLKVGTAIPSGTVVHDVKVADNVATVDLSKSFASGGGSQSMQARVAQVVFTVTQFGDVQRVRFALDGTTVQSIGGEGVMVNGITRTDPNVTNVLPAILVESPTFGASVRSPLHVSGTSNTFEATVNYTLTDPDGLVLQEGHTIATAGTGTWGTFSFNVSFTPHRAGMGSLIVFSVSPKDGSRQNIREVPVQMS